MGATADGQKELIGIGDGFRESEQCWRELLLDLKSRGMTIDPKLAIGDGALGFWKALPQVFTSTRVQRCWMHKTGNVLNKLPKRLHGAAKDLLHQVWMFATVRLRTSKTKGSGSRVACLTMVFKLTESASKKWRCLNGSELIRDVIAGVVFVDGVKHQNPERAAA